MDELQEKPSLANRGNAETWVASHLAPYMNGVRNVLEVGYGRGAITAALARAYPQARVIALEASEDNLEKAEANTASLGNVRIFLSNTSQLPFGPNQFDLVFRASGPTKPGETQQIVKEMGRVCHPGGWVLLQGTEEQFLWHYSGATELEVMKETLVTQLKEKGLNPSLGHDFYQLFHQAGLTDIEVRAESLWSHGGGEVEAFPIWQLKTDISKPPVTEVLEENKIKDFVWRHLGLLEHGDTLSTSLIFTATGVKAGG